VGGWEEGDIMVFRLIHIGTRAVELGGGRATDGAPFGALTFSPPTFCPSDNLICTAGPSGN
jgi:hypothetical protein